MFDTSYFEELQDYLQSSARDDLEGEKLEYYNALYTIIGLNRKYGKDNTIRALMSKPFDCTRRTARRMYSEAINLFYESDDIDNKAYRNMMFQEMRAAALVTIRMAKSAKDMEIYGRLMEQAFRIKQLDKTDEKERDLPPIKPITIWSLDPSAVGLPSENRQLLAKQIDEIPDIAVAEKERLKRESMVKDVDIIEMIDDTKEKTQNID